MPGAESGHLDDLATEEYMGQLEAPPDQPAVAESGPNLLGSGAGCHVIILRIQIQQQVAYTAADHEGLVASLLQPFHYGDRVAADLVALEGVLAGRDNGRRSTPVGGPPEGRG